MYPVRKKLLVSQMLTAMPLILLWPVPHAHAQVLNNQELLARCYAHVTQNQILPSNQAVDAVADGRDPIDACLDVLDKAEFTALGGTRIGNTNDSEAVSVLQTFHKLHVSWFLEKDFTPIVGSVFTSGLRDLYDGEEPAFYFTRALFRPDTALSTVLTHGSSLRSIRTNNSPEKGSASGTTAASANQYIWTTMIHPPTGNLLGIKDVGDQAMTYSVPLPAPNPPQTGTFKAMEHFGGGMLGTQVYLLTNIAPPSANFKADGGEGMPRKLARSIYSDVLCRELPVIRNADAVPFVVPSSTIAFRQSSGCVRCHASMDRTAAVARNFTVITRGRGVAPVSIGFEALTANTPNLAAEAAWPTARDANYWRRPPNGVLYFRSHDGTLVNEAVASLAELGEELSKTDDFYMCVAKRYYSYFIGVDVNVGDIGNPADGIYLSSKDEYHRNRVLTLGRQLKGSQSARQLIESILRSPDYKRRDFGHTKAVQ